MNKALRDQVMSLPYEEKYELAVALWDEIHPPGSARPDEEFVLTPELKAELDRRLDEHKKHPERARPWEEVRAELWARLGK